MKKIIIVFVALLLAITLVGCDKYSQSDLESYEETIQEQSGLTEADGLHGTAVFNENRKLNIFIQLAEPLTVNDFKTYCVKFCAIISADIGIENVNELNIFLFRNVDGDADILLSWSTSDLESGWLDDSTGSYIQRENVYIADWNYETEIDEPETSAGDLKITEKTLERDGNYFYFEATITNNTAAIITYFKVNIYLYNASGNSIDTTWTNWSGSLRPGDSAKVDKMIKYDAEIDQFNTSISDISM